MSYFADDAVYIYLGNGMRSIINSNFQRLLFLHQSFIDTSTIDAKLIYQLLHVYDIHKYLNICKQVYL